MRWGIRGTFALASSLMLIFSACQIESGSAGIAERPPETYAHEQDAELPPVDRAEETNKKGASDKPDRHRKRVPGVTALVTRVIDGDTIEVSRKGRVFPVRLIGIDTPETVHPSEPVECFGKEASAFITGRLTGERIKLEYDVERMDHYDRRLGYIWLEGHLFNRTIVAKGYAQAYTYPPNVKYTEHFLAAQRKARSDNRGLWSGCPSGGKAQAFAGKSATKKGCDPNYSGACVPPYPPDIDCSDMKEKNFRSTGNDPHGFDGDGDGRACET